MLRTLVALLLLPAPALAQAIHGTTIDAGSGERIPGVNVTVLDRAGQPGLTSLANGAGEFQLVLPQGADLRLRFERIGYMPVTSAPFDVKRGQVLDLEIRLAASAVPLEPITIVGERLADPRIAAFYQRVAENRLPGRGRIWTKADLQRLGPVPISDVLSTVNERSACKRREVFVDGLPLSMRPATGIVADRVQTGAVPAPSTSSAARSTGGRTPLPGARPLAQAAPDEAGGPTVDWLVSPEDVEGIEIYRDQEIPPQFNPDGQLCQVTLIWRKSYRREADGGPDLRMPVAFPIVAAIIAATTFLFSRLR